MGDGFFTLRSPEDLYEKAKRDWAAFLRKPSADNLFNLLCTLNHLRDWICPAGPKAYEAKPHDTRSLEERLHHELWEDPDFKVVRDLCNNAKHYSDNSGIGEKSRIVHGFFAGFNFAGDFFRHPNYVARGKELRQVIAGVFARYESYFNERS